MTLSLLAGTAKGAFVFRSEDRRDWRLAERPLFEGWRATAFGSDGAGGVLAATASPVHGVAVHKSADLAAWRRVERGPVFDSACGSALEELWRLARAGDELLAGASDAGLFRSRDGGETWALVEGLSTHPSRPRWFPGFGGLCVHAILADERDPARLWVGVSTAGVFASTDGGATWTARNAGVPPVLEDENDKAIGRCVHALVADPADARRLWRQDHAGMFRSADGGESWERAERGLPSGFGFPLAIDRRTKALFAVPLAGEEHRVPPEGRLRPYRSTDGGDSWHALGEGLPREPVWHGVLRAALCTDAREPTGVYLGTTGGQVFASADGGDTWQRLPGALPRVLALHVVDADAA